MISHPDLKKAYIKLESSDGPVKHVLVLETTLELDNQSPAFDSGRLDDLIHFASEEFRKRQTVLERVDLIPA